MMTSIDDLTLEKERDLNEIALDSCEQNKKTLVFTKRTCFAPSISKVCKMKNEVYFTEEDNLFDVFTTVFHDFDAFVFVDKKLNDFEREFFRQIKIKHIKKVLEIPQ